MSNSYSRLWTVFLINFGAPSPEICLVSLLIWSSLTVPPSAASIPCYQNSILNITSSDEVDLPHFSSQKYLSYAWYRDVCKGVKHFQRSLTCALREARKLNRTFILDDMFCVPDYHNHGVTVKRDIALYFNVAKMQRHVRIIRRHTFNKLIKVANETGLPFSSRTIDLTVRTFHLKRMGDLVLKRKFKIAFGFDVCIRNEALPMIAVAYADSLIAIAKQIADILKSFDTLHIRRGDKARDKVRWPHLDEDTRPPRLTETLKRRLKWGGNLYIATNEENISIFSPLAAHFSLWSLHNFTYLWSRNSKWWNETKLSLGSNAECELQFDGAMKGMVDYEVYKRGNLKLETFRDLTTDPKHGLRVRFFPELS